MKEYFKPKIIIVTLEQDDVVMASAGVSFGQENDNGSDDILW